MTNDERNPNDEASLTEIPVTPEQIAEIERRMKDYRENPTRTTTWEAIKRRIPGSTE